jgi:23S rRNA pseudouridine1911/1915/1917 synthase
VPDIPSTRITFRLGDDPPPRLDRAIVRDAPEAAHLSRSRLARLIEEGRVRVDGVEAAGKARAVARAQVEIDLPAPAPADDRPEYIPLRIVHEDAHLLVIDKPAGMVVHPAPGTPGGTLVNALLHHLGDGLLAVGGARRPGIVHRIDKDTSGLLVVAKTDGAHHGLSRQFAAHAAERRYLALCHGVPDPAEPRLRGLRGVDWDGATLRIATNLARHRTDRQRQAVTWEGGRHAVTRARLLEGYGAAALLECRLETGRTHQIRVHLAHAGHALIGDPVYGGRRLLPTRHPGAGAAAAFPRQALHAASLGFVHPATGETLRFESAMPRDMSALRAALRAES